MGFGDKGFVAWFEGIVYNGMVDACRVRGVRILVHAIGLIVLLLSLYVFVVAMPSFASVAGLLMSFVGAVVFVIPFGVKNTN
jgi:hypothetical protein